MSWSTSGSEAGRARTARAAVAEPKDGDPTFAPPTAPNATSADEEEGIGLYNQGNGGGKWASLAEGLGFTNDVYG